MDRFCASVPMVFGDDGGFFDKVKDKQPVFFLDYDGTLSPIVSNPKDAFISSGMRKTLSALGRKFSVALVSGRDLGDVRAFVQLDHLIYSGSHGFIIEGPGGLHMEHEKARALTPIFDQVEAELNQLLSDRIRGVLIDRKQFAIALHYRNVQDDQVPLILGMADRMVQKYPGLKTGAGKKVVELRPDIDWHKGKAVLWILHALGFEQREEMLPLFIGDDVTDEDAFIALRGRGVGILVGDHGQKTSASYRLTDVSDVQRFLNFFLDSKKDIPDI